MFPFWREVVAPVLEACRARRIVEVGALRGEHTELMLAHLGPDAELHVIDPVPSFDPAVHVARFAGRYVFHQDLSVNVLGSLPAMDAALLDGDHNWYTVLTELRLLAEVARAHERAMPVCILHDVGWPYGRRDLYYDPSNIPEEHRQAWARKGIRPGHERLVPGNGGMNGELANALLEGGPRNGVMTGIEDFVAEHPQPVRLIVLPVFYGLAILVEEAHLEELPELAAVLDRLESNEGKDELLELAERIRLDSLIFDHALFRQTAQRADRATDRYLGAVKEAIATADHRSGLDHLHRGLDSVWSAGIAGDLVVSGGAPDAAAFITAYLEVRDPETRPDHRRRLWILAAGQAGRDSLDLATARERLARLELLDGAARFVEGDPVSAVAGVESDGLAMLHLGPMPAEEARQVVEALVPRLARGGLVVLDAGADAATRAAVTTCLSEHGIAAPDDAGAGGQTWTKREAAGASQSAPAR